MFFEKLANIQNNLRSRNFEELTYENLLPIIFEECNKENILFYFNFIEDTAILKIREFNSQTADLTLRYQYVSANVPLGRPVDTKELKTELLLNAFLITGKGETIEVSQQTLIKESSNVPPRQIREAEAYVKKRGVPVTQNSLENYFRNHSPLKDMDKDTRKQVLDYLRGMKK